MDARAPRVEESRHRMIGRARLEQLDRDRAQVDEHDPQRPAVHQLLGAAGRAEGGHRSLIYGYMAATVQSLLSAMERAGVTTADEVGIDDLAERLRDEAVARKACIILPPFIGAWTNKPA